MIIFNPTNKRGIIFNVMGNILSRIQEISTCEGITIGALERKIGASKGVLSRAINNGTDIQSKWLQIIVDNYPRYSTRWLLTGQGEMMAEVTQDCEMPLCRAVPAVKGSADGQRPIPLVTEQAAAGFGNEAFAIHQDDVKDYYVIPKFRFANVDFMIEVSGLSMYPHFKSGDIIACSILHDAKFIQWNRCHVIATREQGILVKRIMPGKQDGSFLIVSDNKDYPPFDLPQTEITGIALVIGSISLE